MDQSILVRSGQSLVELLDKTAARPRFAMWVNSSDNDNDNWKLWLVPAKGMNDKRAFYVTVADTLRDNSDILPGFDVGNVEYTAESKPVVQALNNQYHIPGLTSVDTSGSLFNGVFLRDGILLRSNL